MHGCYVYCVLTYMLKSPLQCEDINVQGQGKLDIITSQVLKVNNIMHGFRLQHLVS